MAGGLAGTPQHVLIFCNAGPNPRTFLFPTSSVIAEMAWQIAVDTRVMPEPQRLDPTQPIILSEWSLLCLTAPTTITSGKRLASS